MLVTSLVHISDTEGDVAGRLDAYGVEYAMRRSRSVVDRDSGKYIVKKAVFVVDGSAIVSAVEVVDDLGSTLRCLL